MTIIVTGGAGFIGSNFVFHMLKEYPDYRIICLDKLTYAGNLSTLKPVMDNPNFRFVKADICDREAVYALFEEEHPDIVVLAFHTWPELTQDAASFIADHGWDTWRIRFAVDTEENVMLNAIGGDNNMPRTVVLNRRGEVIYNKLGGITPETLNQLLEEAYASTDP